MKTKVFIKLFLLAIVLLCGCFWYSHEEDTLDDLMKANIEALASGEGDSHYHCIGEGSVDCYGWKVEMKVDGYRLDQE